MSDRKPSAFFSADGDLVLLDELSNVFEPDRRFVQLDSMMLRQGVNHVGCSNRLSHAVFPPSALYEVVEQNRDDIVGLKKRAIFIDDSEAVGVAIGSDANLCFALPHALAQGLKKMVVRFGCM